MGSSRPKKEPKDAKAAEPAVEAPVEEKLEVDPAKAEKAARKWKGKDWFTILAPKMFGEADLGEVPATDPQSLVNRHLEVSYAQLTGNPNKYYVKLQFKVVRLEDSQAYTEFHGMKVVKEHVFRIVRKRTSRVEVVTDVTTKDGWQLHLGILAILNRITAVEIEKKVRKKIVDMLTEIATKSTLDDFVKTICDDLIQKNIKKFGSKIYPIRYCEVTKIETVKIPAAGTPAAPAAVAEAPVAEAPTEMVEDAVPR